jgi:transcriptional regulator with XRE-family HTH domain
MDYAALARGVLRQLRGRRSQTAFSRRLGYGTNVAYAWEAGRRFPTAAELFRAATVVGVDLERAVAAFFYGRFPTALEGVDPASPAFAAGLLREVLRPAPLTRLAERTGVGASTLSRTLAAKTQPRLPTYFRLFDAASRRLLDLLAGLVDLEAVPAARDEWRQVGRLRQLAAHNPRFETVPRVLELDAYVHHRPGFVAERLGMSLAEEEQTLQDLEAAGLLRWDGTRWQVDRERSIETTRFDPTGGQSLRALGRGRRRADPRPQRRERRLPRVHHRRRRCDSSR